MDKEGTVITLPLSLLLKIHPIFIDIYPSCIGMNIIRIFLLICILKYEGKKIQGGFDGISTYIH